MKYGTITKLILIIIFKKATTAGDNWGYEYLMFGKATSTTITPNSSGSYRSTLYIDFGPL